MEKQSIFNKRVNILPYDYPSLLKYKDAIRHSYWIDTEYNFTTDINDFKVVIGDNERQVIKRTMLSIAQIEVSVKTFWADLYKRMPITEIGDVGMTFAESEVRHKDAYARLIRILGLEDEFKNVVEIPAIKDRIKYLTKYLDGTRSRDNKMYTKSVLLFSLFIEHVSLFSQFLIMMSFNKELNVFKGISNVVEATSKEEDIHGNFGVELINIIKSENPEWFDEDFENLINSACKKAFNAECKILDWIFESGELDNIEDRKLKRVVKLGQFKDVAALKSELSPKQKSFVSKVLPKKATKEEKVVEEVLKEPANEKTLEESSDEATLANDSE